MISLDDSLWSDLTHAYGNAADIPPLLRAIAAHPSVSSPTEGPWFELWSALCHQGDVYSASFAAVPHIIDVASANPDRACFDFFLMPAAIDVARHQHAVSVPEPLSDAYFSSLNRLPLIVAATAGRSWDATFCQSALAAVAVGKQQHAIAELLLVVDDSDIPDVLDRYFER
jgi:hypothetical protein